MSPVELRASSTRERRSRTMNRMKLVKALFSIWRLHCPEKRQKLFFFFHAKSEEAQTTVSIQLNGAETLATSSYLLAARQDLNKGGEISMKTVANLDIGNTISVFLEEGKLQEKPVFAGKIILP